MPRNRKSAKQAGARFERHIADWLNQHVSEYIDRRTKTGAKDRGDLTGVRMHGERIAVELKTPPAPTSPDGSTKPTPKPETTTQQ